MWLNGVESYKCIYATSYSGCLAALVASVLSEIFSGGGVRRGFQERFEGGFQLGIPNNTFLKASTHCKGHSEWPLRTRVREKGGTWGSRRVHIGFREH